VKKELAVAERDVAALCRLGLTEYESRIYLALVRMGPRKASEVSFFGQVPRTKAYGAIRELERKGLLKIITGKPELYVPSSPTDVLMPLVAKFNHEVKESEDVVNSLALTYESSKYIKRDMPTEASEFWQIDGRQNINNKLNQMFADAKQFIDYTTSSSGLIRAYKVHSEAMETAKKHGAKVRILSPISPESSAVAQEFSHVVELKRLEKPFMANFTMVDGKELVVIETKPDDLRTDRGSAFGIWTTNKLLVELHAQLFERVWESLPAPQTQGKSR
jgi:sugar-specific transcriptional regulator TrmB